MKAFKLIGGTAAAALLLLTSCLGESNNTMSRSSFAVAGVSDRTYVTVLNTNIGALYSPSLNTSVVNGSCYLVSYELDLNSPENANAATNGYYTATTLNVSDEISNGLCNYAPTDTSTLIKDEIPVKNLFASSDYGVYVDGHLFLFLTLDMLKDQRNAYTLYWDRSKEATEVDGVPTYDLFIRASKSVDGTGSTVTSTGEVRAFDAKNIVETINRMEANNKSTTFTLKVNYLSSINENDSTIRTWNSYPISFAVVEE